jgi:nucleosome binding factor SPN SPT16 subunit
MASAADPEVIVQELNLVNLGLCFQPASILTSPNPLSPCSFYALIIIDTHTPTRRDTRRLTFYSHSNTHIQFSIKNRDVAHKSISCKNITNIDKTLEWIVKRANAHKSKV